MNMVEGTALVFLKIGGLAAVIIVAVLGLCRVLEKRGRRQPSDDEPGAD